MTWLVRKVLALFRGRPTGIPSSPRHEAVKARADRLLRIAHDYEEADEARREHR